MLILGGEAIRLWAAGHIGRSSRTRGSEVGPLVTTGPYARMRNPLYLGNILMAAGFGALSHTLLAAAWWSISVGYYSAIVRWEEQRLQEHHGREFTFYCQRVPRWAPMGAGRRGEASLRTALRSERSTLLVWALLLGATWALG